MKAFSGESQARNRYTFSPGPRKERLNANCASIRRNSITRKRTCKTVFQFPEGGDVEITDSYPAGKAGTTLDNLKAAAATEEHEWSRLYPEFAKTAREEGAGLSP